MITIQHIANLVIQEFYKNWSTRTEYARRDKEETQLHVDACINFEELPESEIVERCLVPMANCLAAAIPSDVIFLPLMLPDYLECASAKLSNVSLRACKSAVFVPTRIDDITGEGFEFKERDVVRVDMRFSLA